MTWKFNETVPNLRRQLFSQVLISTSSYARHLALAHLPAVDDASSVAGELLAPILWELADNLLAERIDGLINELALVAVIVSKLFQKLSALLLTPRSSPSCHSWTNSYRVRCACNYASSRRRHCWGS